MKTVLLILGGKVANNEPIAHFLLRLESAIEYYRQHNTMEDIVFLVSGRWTTVTENFLMTEAEIGKQFILQKVPSALVVKEDISVELIGNYAFSKPLITLLHPDKVVIFTSEFMLPRNVAIAQRLFSGDFSYEHRVITTDLSDNPTLVDKEKQATKLFENLFKDIDDGDDAAFRNKLLYSTPYYFKLVIDDKIFFDMYWDGGYEHYLNALTVRNKI